MDNSDVYNYWQCFPRDQVSVILEDTGSSSEDFGWKDTIGDLQIRVWVNSGVIHQYEVRKAWTVNDFQKDFNRWRKLMKEEKYVCLGGSFGRREKKEVNGMTQEVYEWTFDKIKTRKGCAGYWDDCNLTYKQYMDSRSDEDKK